MVKLDAIKLSEYDIEYKNWTSAKSQVLTEFITELPLESTQTSISAEKWTLHVDGASSRHISGVGVRLELPAGEVLEQFFRLKFPASNNEAEYEALISRLRLAREIRAKHIHPFCESQLVASQFSGGYETKNERMDAYLKVAHELAKDFYSFKLTKIPQGDNTTVDALAALASTSDPHLRLVIPVESITNSSIELPRGVCRITNQTSINAIRCPIPNRQLHDNRLEG